MQQYYICHCFKQKPHQLLCKSVRYYPDTSPFALLCSNVIVSATNYEVALNHSLGICVDISQTCTLFSKLHKTLNLQITRANPSTNLFIFVQYCIVGEKPKFHPP